MNFERDASNDLALGQEAGTEFVDLNGTTRTIPHSALLLALASSYGGRGTAEPNPFMAVPEKRMFQARAELRELLDAFEGLVEALDERGLLIGADEIEPLVENAKAVLKKHNRPRQRQPLPRHD